MKKDHRYNFMILGGKEPQAYGLLLSTLVSLTSQIDPQKLKLVVAEFEQTDSPYSGFFSRLTEYLPHMVIDVANKRNAVEHLDALVSIFGQITTWVFKKRSPAIHLWIIPGAPPMRLNLTATMTKKSLICIHPFSSIIYNDITCIFLICGLQRWRELRGNRDDYDPNIYVSKLLSLAEDGPEHGIHLVIWSDTYGTLSRFDFERALEFFDMRAYLRLTDKDSGLLLDNGSAASWEIMAPCFVMKDGRVDGRKNLSRMSFQRTMVYKKDF